MAQRKSIHLKIFVGVVVLLACGAYWIYENDSAKASARYPRDVDWSRFSLLNERSSGPQEERKKKKQASVVILFGLSDCETHEEAFNAWTNGTAQYENIDLVGGDVGTQRVDGRPISEAEWPAVSRKARLDGLV
jgi:hypothetical protein